jgi:hypothetical protein
VLNEDGFFFGVGDIHMQGTGLVHLAGGEEYLGIQVPVYFRPDTVQM